MGEKDTSKINRLYINQNDVGLNKVAYIGNTDYKIQMCVYMEKKEKTIICTFRDPFD